MKNLSPHIEQINQIVLKGMGMGLLQVKASNHTTNGRTIDVGDKKLTYFGNCSYLGLEHDERIKTAAIDAINRYGLQYACSRSYSSLTLYDELESLLGLIFEKPTLVSPTTSIGHIANITTLVTSDDAIILDHQVHASVKNAVQMAKANGTHVETIRHNRMDILEDRIKVLKDQHKRIWYMSDGVYSMYGDSAPFSDMYALMEQYEQFWCYVDDAHGMSWSGKYGQGFALDHFPAFHDKMLLTVSLVKGFGVHGGALIYPNTDIKNMVRNCGSSFIFASPMPPAYLAANIASAKIHLTDEIKDLQDKLKHRISYFNMTAKGLKIPLINEEKTPIFFIPVGTPDTGYSVMKDLYDANFLVNLAAFPAVPYKNTGLRTILTNHHTLEDIFEILTAIKFCIDSYVSKTNVDWHKNISKAFAGSVSF
jgi:7-keto-8-aminopelargonate synthetase-like enzyme